MNEVSDCGSAAEMVTTEDIPRHTENMVDLSGACNPAPSKTPMAGTSGPSGSTGVVRMLNFIVEYRDANIPLTLADTETVGRSCAQLQVRIRPYGKGNDNPRKQLVLLKIPESVIH